MGSFGKMRGEEKSAGPKLVTAGQRRIYRLTKGKVCLSDMAAKLNKKTIGAGGPRPGVSASSQPV
jgi:hypothetical protein